MSHGDKIIVALQDLNDQLESGAPIPVTVVRRESTPDGPLHTFRKGELVMKPLTDAQLAELRRHLAAARAGLCVVLPDGCEYCRTFAGRVALWCVLGLAAVLAAAAWVG